MPTPLSPIPLLRSLTQADIQSHWRWHQADLPAATATRSETWTSWAIAPLNDRQHIAWARGQRVLWLGQRITVPETLEGFPLEGLTLRLGLTWWAEDAQIYVNGRRVHGGDLFDCFTRILLLEAVKPGDGVEVAIRLVSPGHDDGALVRSRCLYENPDQDLEPVPEPGFVADELEVLQIYLNLLAPAELERVNQAVEQLDWEAVGDRPRFNASLAELRQRLLPFSDWLKQRTLHLLGHAHLDLAWLWPIADTWEAAQRTFKSVLELQADYPELVFSHSTPALYAWVENHCPALFEAIQAQVLRGTWEVAAGLWVEPELNLIGGESLVRQVLYGQRYTQAAFGQLSRVAWLPDSFGFCWQLPQILKQGRVDYFATQKLRWNDTTQFPHDLFQWRSPDGTEVLSLTLPPIGTDVDPVKMADYAAKWEVQTGQSDTLWLPGVGDHGGGPTRDMLSVARRWGRSPFFPRLTFTSAHDFLDQIVQKRLETLESVEFREPEAVGEANHVQNTPGQAALEGPPALNSGEARGAKSPSIGGFRGPASSNLNENSTPSNAAAQQPLPVWSDELYLELHRGCYTTHADQKQWNRQCEALLYEAELFAAFASLSLDRPYPGAALETAWKQVLFNQFHDILPGSSIPEVYSEANPNWEAAEATAEALLLDSIGAIAQQIQLPPAPHPEARPFVVFNSLTWSRSEVVTVACPNATFSWTVLDSTGRNLPVQRQDNSLFFAAESLPGIGYALFWLVPVPEVIPEDTEASAPPDAYVLENAALRVEVDNCTGELVQVFDKQQGREVLTGRGNQLQLFRDQGQYWDAWNIDPAYEQHPLPGPKCISVERVAWGPVQQIIHVVYKTERSRIQQDYVLQGDEPLLRIDTCIDWQETYTLLKTSFPLNVTAEAVTCDMACGAIARSLTSPDPADRAKWEVPALSWADLSHPTQSPAQSGESGESGESAYGVSLLSTCKHGYDARPSCLRLTLLKSPLWPDPTADRGYHQFTYALYPHGGAWNQAETTRWGYALRHPLRVVDLGDRHSIAPEPSLPPVHQWVNLPAPNLFPMALKPAEPDSSGIGPNAQAQPQKWLLRLYEGHGESATVTPETLFSPDSPTSRLGYLQFSGVTNLLEELPQASDQASGQASSQASSHASDGPMGEVAIAPWQIKTLLFEDPESP